MTKRLQVAFAVLVLTACGGAADNADSTATSVDPSTKAVAATATTDATTTTAVTTADTTPIPTTTTTAAPTTTTPPTTTTTTMPAMPISAPPTDEAAAVHAAYAAHWEVFYSFINGEAPGDPADYFAGDRLARLPTSVAEYSERDWEVGGSPMLQPGEVTIDGDTASFTDCQLDLTFAVSRTTGETVIPPSSTPQAVAVELIRSDGVWKVSWVKYDVEGSCVQ